MANKRVLFISQEVTPYLSAGENSTFGKELPHLFHANGYEARLFMPRFGAVNERRNQLHEVIRLSGMNIMIGDNDHPLTVKVASMQPSRIQVYFIDNDDYFQHLDSDSDPFGSNRADNDERVIFFARGTMETARKLRWEPAVMQVSGWMSTLMPMYLKTLFRDSPNFTDTKVVYTVLPEAEISPIDPAFFDKLRAEGISADTVDFFRPLAADPNLLHKLAISYADAVVFQTETADPDLTAFAEEKGIAWKHLAGEGDHADEYDALYKSLMTS